MHLRSVLNEPISWLGNRPFATKGHSPQWVKRHVSDRYVQKAQHDMYRSRAAYKLRHIDNDFKILKRRSVVVDLGCFAGGWSQVVLERVRSTGDRAGLVIGVDVTRMEPLDNHVFVQGDIRDASTLQGVRVALAGKPASVVLADLAPKMTGSKGDDHLASVALCREAVRFAEAFLEEGGSFVTKIFLGAHSDEHFEELSRKFGKVRRAKPPSSRADSREIYFVCTKYHGTLAASAIE